MHEGMAGQGGLSPWLQLFVDVVMHWLFTKSGVGRAAFSYEAYQKAFVIAYKQAWKIAYKLLAKSQTPHIENLGVYVNKILDMISEFSKYGG